LLQGDVKVNDKTLHFVAYAGLAFLLAWSLPRRVGPLPGLWVVAAVTVLYAILDEWTQGFVPRRSPDVADFLADMLGMSVGLISYLLLKRLLFPNRPQQPRWQAG
jgi:VanZ family protein